MNNCGIKIRANNSHEKAEILDCFKELGLIISYKFPECDDFFFVRSNGAVHSCENAINSDDYEWVSLAQLKDRVVLHRNNVHDATHCDNQHKFIYLTSDKVVYYWDGEWLNSAINKSNGYENYITKRLTVIPNGQEITPEYNTIKVEGLEGLVDGKAALTAALAGETVQISVEPWEEKNWDTFNPLEDDVSTKVFFSGMSEGVQKVFFRIKPKTILINGVEVPAPFKPKHSDIGFILDNAKDCYREFQYVGQHIPFGWWRTEEEIKQVVAALRKVFEVQS
ncbi:hypothetical protein [Acinetobacter baumannii]|uniref:hypothetical protein n=1 Tax=Acinetobacter baumannii TaxID=470 RepID=UPI00298D0444|nr:hypothetical protein [Acinetobacter baumannii]WNX62332.1 hypothetical protein RWV42_12105 [Acinetobacter baumannii]